jgi:TrmH family RNA methyltransferase
MTDTKTPQGILAVVEKNKNKEIDYSKDFLIILDNIQDPGNLGTIIRTADSCDLGQVIVSTDTVDCYSPKVIRSTMGSSFRINVIERHLVETIKEIKAHGFEIIVTSLQTDKSIYDVDYSKKAIIIGNEANGVRDEIMKEADLKVKIPMLGKTESLNASIAAGVMMYEYSRQKITKM